MQEAHKVQLPMRVRSLLSELRPKALADETSSPIDMVCCALVIAPSAAELRVLSSTVENENVNERGRQKRPAGF